MKRMLLGLSLFCMMCMLGGCREEEPIAPTNTATYQNIVFSGEQWYAIAYLGEDDQVRDAYLKQFVRTDPIYFYDFEGEERFLIIPRYEEMVLSLSEQGLVGEESEKVVETFDPAVPLLLEGEADGNASNIKIELTYGAESIVFSPVLVQNGQEMHLELGERAVDLTAQFDEDYISK